MLKCLSLESPSASSSVPPSPAAVTLAPPPPCSQGTSSDGTPRRSTQVSPGANILREFTSALETPSYKEMVSKIVEVHSSRHKRDKSEEEEEEEVISVDQVDEDFLVSEVLHPNRECVEEALLHAKQPKSSALKALVSQYFNHSERTARHLCHVLCQSIDQARRMYGPIQNLLEVLQPVDSITQAQADHLYEMFVQFDRFDNPFSCPANHTFQETRRCYSELKQQLDMRLLKSQSTMQRCKRAKAGSAYCLIGATVGVVISALVIVTHAVAAVAVICPFAYSSCASATTSTSTSTRKKKKEVGLDTARQGAYYLKNHLATTDCLVSRLYTTIEDDKNWIRLGLKSGPDLYLIQQVFEKFRQNQVDYRSQLKLLQDHIYICFNNINKNRSRLLQEIHLFLN